MEQHGIGKHTVLPLRGQFELQEALHQHLAATVSVRQRRVLDARSRRTAQWHSTLKVCRSPPKREAKIQQVEGRWPGHVL